MEIKEMDVWMEVEIVNSRYYWPSLTLPSTNHYFLTLMS